MNLNLCLNITSSMLFVMYGLLCLTSDRMVQEFDRYGLTKLRVLIGVLELCGGFGQGFGYFLYKPLVHILSRRYNSTYVFSNYT